MEFSVEDYEYLRVPNEVAKTIVHSKDYICTRINGRRRRKIFYNVELEESEIQATVELEKKIANKNLELPIQLKSRPEMLKYLIVAKFNLEEAEKLALGAIKYWQSYHWRTFSRNVLENLESGVVYLAGRDNELRPIIVVNAHLVDWNKLNVEEFIYTLDANLTIARHIMFHPFHIENWLLFIETNNIGLFSFPYDVVKPIVSTSRTQYPCTTEHTFMLNPSLSFVTTFKIASSFMDPTSREKTSLVRKEEFKSAFANIPENQLEEKYGGTMPNKSKFWPPQNTLENHPRYQKSGFKGNSAEKEEASKKPLIKVEKNENKAYFAGKEAEEAPRLIVNESSGMRFTEIPKVSAMLNEIHPREASKSLGPKDIFSTGNGPLACKKDFESQSCTEEDLDFRESLRSSIKEIYQEAKEASRENSKDWGYNRESAKCGFCLGRRPVKRGKDEKADENLLACFIF